MAHSAGAQAAGRRRRRRRSSVRPYVVVLALVAAVSFALSFLMTYLVPPVAFFSLPDQSLAIGARRLGGSHRRPLASAVHAYPPAFVGWTGLVMILLACTLLSGETSYPGTAALLPTLGAMLVIGAGCAEPSRGVGRALGVPVMGAIGRVSYSWYLWHWPVLVLTPPLLGHQVGLGVKLIAVLVSLGLAVLTVRFVENPFRFAERVRTSPAVSLGVGGLATAVAVCVGLVVYLAVPTPVGRGPAIEPVVASAPSVSPGVAASGVRRGGAGRVRRGGGRGRGVGRPARSAIELDPAADQWIRPAVGHPERRLPANPALRFGATRVRGG